MADRLDDIAAKLADGQRLGLEDGLALLTTPDIWTLGELADAARRRLHGDRAYYNVNRHLNYTNVCALSCRFCSFYRKEGDQGAYAMTVEEIAEQARAAAAASTSGGASGGGATEIHIVGGLHPRLPFAYYLDMLAAIRAAAPSLHIKAFTAVEIVHLARIDRRPHDIEGVLRDLRDAGLDSLPGGGAEVFDDRVHDAAFKGKIRSDQWLAVHAAAHRLGLMSNATILYGHIESLEDRVRHLLMLRDAQDRAICADGEDFHHREHREHREEVRSGSGGSGGSGGGTSGGSGASGGGTSGGRFQAVIPLPFIPDGCSLSHLPGPTGVEDLRMLAVSRLMLDNFPHVKAFWIMQTLPFSQVALHYGVDDMDGTVVWYDITKVGGASTHQEVTVQQLRRAILQAGLTPIERDTLYRPRK